MLALGQTNPNISLHVLKDDFAFFDDGKFWRYDSFECPVLKHISLHLFGSFLYQTLHFLMVCAAYSSEYR